MYQQNTGNMPEPLLPGAQLPPVPQEGAADADVFQAIDYHGHPEAMTFDQLTDIDNL